MTTEHIPWRERKLINLRLKDITNADVNEGTAYWKDLGQLFQALCNYVDADRLADLQNKHPLASKIIEAIPE